MADPHSIHIRTWISSPIVTDDGSAAVLWETGPEDAPISVGVAVATDADEVD